MHQGKKSYKCPLSGWVVLSDKPPASHWIEMEKQMADKTEVQRFEPWEVPVTYRYDVWVRAFDYDRLAAKLAEVEANINIKADFIDATINQLAASDQRIEELEAKLAECEARLEKAVELAFDECPFRYGTGSYWDWWHYRRKELEALKGQKDG